jgi:hypothetical protein
MLSGGYGGGCGCDGFPRQRLRNYNGGYKPTAKDKATLRRYKRGESIGFTGRSSLKAKGMIPRSSGKYVLGPKYSGTGRPIILTRPSSRKTRRNRK